MKRGPHSQREDRIQMWAGVGAGAFVLVIFTLVVVYGFSEGAFL